ncbi:energy transducer TonB [Ferruginibacter lapsinanis]|uniref:energy transducer TonB n=1 Tax=Ferruginibacter lapsinanis TaxID=563172 RepID=UPI001E546766|nr:energy transducer TonB [Ferruginibacter lapsinanis]UEG49333.1 energy transducer TonB [Ferruginibacter lapsinanis]
MSKYILGALFLLFSNIITAQEIVLQTDSTGVFMHPTPVVDTQSLDNIVFTKVEKDAEFPGGASAWAKYLQRNLNALVPIKNGAPKGSYLVVIRFIVDMDGSVSTINADVSPGYGTAEEVIRIIKEGPKWTPARQNGRIVRAYRKQPVTFVVQ